VAKNTLISMSISVIHCYSMHGHISLISIRLYQTTRQLQLSLDSGIHNPHDSAMLQFRDSARLQFPVKHFEIFSSDFRQNNDRLYIYIVIYIFLYLVHAK